MEKNLEKLKRELKSLGEDVVDIWHTGGAGVSVQHEDSGDPCPPYERPAQGKPFGMHWAQPLPQRLNAPLGGRIDLLQSLKLSDAPTVDRDSAPALQALSLLLHQLRQGLIQQPALRSLDDFHLYGLLLRRLNLWFYSCNVRFVPYFAVSSESGGTNTTGVCSLIMEYLQVMQLTVLRLYNDVTLRSEAWSAEDSVSLMHARMVMEELLTCCQYCLSEKFTETLHSDRWFCQEATRSIASTTSNSNSGAEDSPMQADKKRLRHHIEKELGGVQQMRSRLLLLECKSTEVVISLLFRLDEESDAVDGDDDGDSLAERVDFVHNKLAPLMLHCASQYAELESQEKERRRKLGIGGRAGRLQSYARFASLCWHIASQLLLAENEAQCYESEHFEDRVPMGKSALKRLDELLQLLDERVKSIPKLDQEWGSLYDERVMRAEKLQARLKASLSKSYFYQADEVDLWPCEAHSGTAKKTEDYKEFTRKFWVQYLERLPEDQAQLLQQALTLLESMYKRDRSATTPVLMINSRGGTLEEGPHATASQTMSDERSSGILEERRRCYAKLVALADASGQNRILLESDQCDALRNELKKVEKKMRQ